tara:strand:+ start:308 stop:526 length:219 start_codon:yes stop_codon:yes gene_type:complete
MKKTKEQIIKELDALQKNYADEKQTLGEVMNKMQEQLYVLNGNNTDLELMMQTYEKTVLVLTKRLIEARERL